MNAEAGRGLLFPSHHSPARNVLWVATIALVYFVVAGFSLFLAFRPEGIAAIWPASGIFLSAVLLTRRDLRPWLVGVLFITDFIAEHLAGTPFLVSALYSLSLAGDAVLSAWLLIRFVGEPLAFRRVRDVVGWLALSVLLSNALTSLVAAGASELLPGTHSFWNSWQKWAIPDGVGNLLVTPFILAWAAWARNQRQVWNRQRILEWSALLVLLVLANFALFNNLSQHKLFAVFLPYATFPFLLWAALRFGARGVTTAMLLMTATIISFVVTGRVPSFSFSPGVLDDVVVMQLFLAIMAVPSLLLAAVVAERRKAEAARLAGTRRHAVTLKSIGDAVIATDTRGRVELINPVAETLTGWTNEEASGKRLEEVFHIINEDTRQAVENPVEKVLREGKVVGLANHTVLVAKGGVERPIADSGAPIQDEENEIDGVVLVFRDQTLERAATKVLQESEQRYRAIMEQAVDAIILRDETGRILDVNQKACQNLGYTREELLSKTVADIDPEAVRAGKQDVWGKILAGEVFTFESHQLRKDGSTFPVEVTQKLVRLPLGPAVLGIVRDITERKQAAEKLRETNRALRMISDCNQELVRATNEADLLKNICRLIVERCDYRMAWVGFAGQDAAKSVRPAAQFGFEGGYLDTVNITWADTERGRGPVGTAIRTGQPVIARNILTDPAYGPWREAAIKRGYASSIALPLQHEGCCFGVLSFYAATPDAFDSEEVELLSELADDLAYGISALRHRAERELVEGELERTAHDWQITFDATNDAVWILDNDHRVLRTNKTAERFFHRPCREMLGQHCWSIVHGTAEPHPDCPFVRARKSGRREMMEFQQGEIWFEVVVDPILDAAGRYAGAVHIVSDITERKQAGEKIARQLEELQRWQEVMLGREDRVQQLKREVNELCRRMDAAARYPSQEAGPEDAAATKPNL